LFLVNSFGRRAVQLLLIFLDGLFFVFSYWLVHSVRFFQKAFSSDIATLTSDHRFWTVLFFSYFSLYIFDLYEPRGWRKSISSPLRIFLAYLASLLLVFAWLYLFAEPGTEVFGRGVLLGSLTLFSVLTFGYRRAMQSFLKREVEKNRFLLISDGPTRDSFQTEFTRKESGGYVEHLSTDTLSENPTLIDSKLREKWSAVVVDGSLPKPLVRRLMQYRLAGVRILSVPDFYEVFWAKIPVNCLDEGWFTFTEGFGLLHNRVNARIKRVVDILVSLTLLVLLAPFMVLLWVIIQLESRGPAVYRQTRVGREGKTFTIYKFRSMRLGSEKDGAKWAQQNDDRTTRIGRLIRKIRLDETPQLINILRGEMSFIGPRPERTEVTEQLAQAIPFYAMRHLVKPGLTGWAQVMYPCGASIEDAREKLEFELYYIKNQSLELDLKTIAKTLSVVMFGSGR